jgi:hypothetical protein
MKHQFQDLSGLNLWLNNNYLTTYENISHKSNVKPKALTDKNLPPKASKAKEENE